jgi:hypothetical protein
MAAPGSAFSVPLSAPPAQRGAAAGRAGQLVADFLGATESLSCEAAAELAGVRAETIRKWRRRLPRWLKEETSRRMAACLAAKPLPDRDESFRRSFRRVLRSVPGSEHGPLAPMNGRIPP